MEILDTSTFLRYFERVRARTLRVAACIPAEHIDWTWREGKFTLGDLIRHIAATERFMFAENVRGRPSRYPGHGSELADGYDAVMDYLDTMHREAVILFRELTNEELRQPCNTPAGASIPVWKWLRAMIEHEIHHRGQIYLYLSMLGIETPPLYGLTSEEVHERSR